MADVWFQVSVLAFSLIALVSSVLVFTIFGLCERLRHHPSMMLFWISVGEFFFIFCLLPGAVGLGDFMIEHSVLCVAVAAFNEFFSVLTQAYACLLTINLSLTLKNPFSDTHAFIKWYHTCAWGSAVLATIVLLATDQAGAIPEESTCWVKSELGQVLFQLPTVFFAANAIGIALPYATYKLARGLPSSQKHRFIFLVRLFGYAVIYWFLLLLPLVHRVSSWIYGHDIVIMTLIGEFGLTFHNVATFLFVATTPNSGLWEKVHSICRCNAGEEMRPLSPKHSQMSVTALVRGDLLTSIVQGIHIALQHPKFHGFTEMFDVDELNSLHRLESSQTLQSVTSDMSSGSLQYGSIPEEAADVTASVNEFAVNSDALGDVFIFSVYDEAEFHAIRRIAGISTRQYKISLAIEDIAKTLADGSFSEGRSGSFFWISRDKQVVMKTLSKQEALLLQKIVPQYRLHLAENPSSLLNKFYGLYSIRLAEGPRTYVVVMENIFKEGLPLQERYDLKGSYINRSNRKGKSPLSASSLRLDNDMKRYIKMVPGDRVTVMKALESDTELLETFGIMDYSLLIGVHRRAEQERDDGSWSSTTTKDHGRVIASDNAEETEENQCHSTGYLSSSRDEVYFLGIIDMLQVYDLNKKAEHFAKTRLLCRDAHGISAVSPGLYSVRFLNALSERIVSPVADCT